MNSTRGVFFSSLVVFFFVCFSANALTPAQIRQVEEIAQNIASQADAEPNIQAVANGRNVRFKYTVQDLDGLSPATYAERVRKIVTIGTCRRNADNPAFDRGLSYTFLYVNEANRRLAEFTIDKNVCNRLN